MGNFKKACPLILQSRLLKTILSNKVIPKIYSSISKDDFCILILLD